VEDLVRWLGACLDEDQRIVQEANTSPEMVTGIPRSYAQAPVAVHIATFADPARVLREIDAKRRTLIRCEEEMASGVPRLTHFAKQTVREMAAVYEDRPGYEAALAAFE
jgi:hypothetical protein